MMRIARTSKVWRVALVLVMILALFTMAAGSVASPGWPAPPMRFRVRLTAQAALGIAELGLDVPVTGRVFVIITQDDGSEPRE